MSENQMAGQSPPPERQAPKQQREPPSNAHGVNKDSKSKEESEAQMKELASNPEGQLDSHLEELSKKKYKNVSGEMQEI